MKYGLLIIFSLLTTPLQASCLPFLPYSGGHDYVRVQTGNLAFNLPAGFKVFKTEKTESIIRAHENHNDSIEYGPITDSFFEEFIELSKTLEVISETQCEHYRLDRYKAEPFGDDIFITVLRDDENYVFLYTNSKVLHSVVFDYAE